LLLISSYFIDSDFCYKEEFNKALNAKANNGNKTRIIPIILSQCLWKVTPFGEKKLSNILALPDEGKPIVKWDNIDDALTNVADGIYKVVQDLRG
jgi:hypothetical protein